MKPLVTIAIPVYNGMPYIEDAIYSVLNQTFTNWILYVINDGSTDGSIEIIRSIINNDSRIILINDGLQKGLVKRLNQSIEMTQTKYYARMDADDIMFVTRLEEQVSFLENHPDVDVLGASVMTIDNHNNIVGSGLSVGKVSSFIHPTVIGRTEWFQKNNYSDWAVRAEDFELWCRTSRNSSFYAIGKPLLFYREFGVPTFKKTILSLRTKIKIYRCYRKYDKSLLWCCKGVGLTVLKICVYAIFNAIGKMDYIVSKRKRTAIPSSACLTKSDLELCVKKENSLLEQ